MKHLRRFVLVLVGLACSMAVTMAMAQGLERELTINIGEMFFQTEGQARNETIASTTAVPYKITFRKIGAVVHRVKFGRGLVVEEGVPFAYAENLFADILVKVRSTGEETSFRVVASQLIELDLDAGEEIEVLFTLPTGKAGTWELGCFVIGHYEAGMHTALVISKASRSC